MIKKIAIITLAFFSFTSISSAEEISKNSSCFKYVKGAGNKSKYRSSKEKCLKPIKKEVVKEDKLILKEAAQPVKPEYTPAPEQEKPVEENQNIQKPEIISEVKEEKKEPISEKIKTEGHYVGISAIGSLLTFHDHYSDDIYPNGDAIKPTSSGNGLGFGLDYKYAFNFNDFFIAPGAFFEKHYLSEYGSRKAYNPRIYGLTRIDIDSRYGVSVNAGYDINDTFSPYATFGYSLIDYTTKNGIRVGDVKQSAIKRGRDGAILLGGGFKINYDQNTAFNFEVNTQKFSLKTNLAIPNNQYLINGIYIGRLTVAKIGLLYNF